jgi:hypothetical protein
MVSCLFSVPETKQPKKSAGLFTHSLPQGRYETGFDVEKEKGQAFDQMQPERKTPEIRHWRGASVFV